jgi:octaprenyl-diphosphate synthase
MSRDLPEPAFEPAPAPTATSEIGVREIVRLVEEKIAAVEETFLRSLRSDVSIIDEAGRYIYDGGGKRVRPLLLLLCSRMAGYRGDRDVLYASVFELIHTATLAHDDVIDDAEVRRGRESLNSRFNNSVTVLLGDYLYIKSMSVALLGEDLAFLNLLADITLKMIEGEIIQSRRRGAIDVTEEEHLDIIRRKTAYLFAGCARAAGMLAGLEPERIDALERYGLNLGMEFQLIDDLLDFTADEKILGKPIGNDLKEGRLTLPLIYLLETGDPKAWRAIGATLDSGQFDAGHRDEILRLLRQSGSLERARDTAARYAGAASRALEGFDDSPARQALLALPDTLLARNR